MRALPGEPPQSLTAEPDGTVLEDLIGELQSSWGVPQYPQEYRLLIKVAESRDRSSTARSEASDEEREPKERRAPDQAAVDTRSDGQPRREKAPLPQELSGGTGPAAERPAGSRSGRRRRRRRRRGGGGDSGTG